MLFFSLAFILLFAVGIDQSQGTQSQGSALYESGNVYCKARDCKFVNGPPDWKHATAVGSFNDSLLASGWGILDINSGFSAKHTNEEIMFAAGFMEGALTSMQMESQYTNLHSIFFPKPDPDLERDLDLWFTYQRVWAEDTAYNNSIYNNTHTPTWRHVSYVLTQLDGLYAGYRSIRGNSSTALKMFAINFMNANGDLFDILKIIRPSRIVDWRKLTAKQAENYFYSTGHCSALIKMLPGFENVFMSHSSWFDYRATNRIYKHYNFNVDDPFTAAKKMSFSSYGGYLESLDDFYHLSSGLVMLQTTNSIFNTSLYDQVHPQALLSWQRVRVANMMARGGKEWSDILAYYNSGTYNNQYMILNTNLIKPGMPLPDDTLWVAEQIPGLVVAADTTAILRTGYWPSYNVPFFEEIFNKSGYPAYVEKHGEQYSYQLAPRAMIFRRDANNVKDMDSMKAIMRYNDYKHDPYSGKSPWGAICSRGDLDSDNPRPDGCYDTKVSDIKMARKFQADIINGPTLGTGLPPFSWTGQWEKLSHVGLPQTYNYTFVRTEPRFQ